MNYQLIPVSRISPSGTNPRKHFEDAAMADLVESVKVHGVLQPVLVRPHPKRDGDYELVCGERRWLATMKAKLAEIPAIVRELEDKPAFEIQVIENLQRSDLHPMEEAQGYERLTHEFEYTVDDLAAKVGKSKAYVYGRLKLLALVPAARKAFESGALTPSVALLVARVPASLQQDVLDECCVTYEGEPAPLRDVQIEIERSYMLRLSEAKWSLKDDSLPGGPCTICPKRTGNQPDLFADVKAKDTCTDPECFKAKRAAHAQRTLEQAKQKGQEVKAPGAVLDDYGRAKKGYVVLSERCEPLGWDSQKTWSKALAKAKVEPILTTNKAGDVVEVLPAAEAMEALKETGAKIERGGVPDTEREEQKRRAKAKAFNLEVALAMTPKIIEEATVGNLVRPEVWELLARRAYQDANIYDHAFVAKRRGLADKVTGARAALDEWFEQEHQPTEWRDMTLELMICAKWGGEWEPTFNEGYRMACEAIGVDLEAMEQEMANQRDKPKVK